MNDQNLRPVRTKEEARARGRRGGQRSGEVRRNRKAVREALDFILSLPVSDEAALKDIKKNNLPMPDDPCYLDYIVSSTIIRTARRGQVADLQKIMEILGETPTEGQATLNKAIEILSSVESVIDE